MAVYMRRHQLLYSLATVGVLPTKTAAEQHDGGSWRQVFR
jgi:hypothetical protein